MIKRTLNDLARIAHGKLIGAERAFTSVSTDSRTIQAGALFVALKGPNFDGHAFVSTAATAGAAAALVERQLTIDLPQVVVPDALAALSQFAREWRRNFQIPVVAVTGSNGKTTTKEIIGSILSRGGPCWVTRGNLNNHIGVPLTLLGLDASHRSAVIEMGANHQGEIAALVEIAEPTVGLVTNAGAAHLEGFGGLEGVARGKGEMFRGLTSKDTAVINVDDVYAETWRATSGAGRVVTFGVAQPADFTAKNISANNEQHGFRSEFDLITPLGNDRVVLHLAGLHNLRNALGAAAAAFAAGATLAQIKEGFAAMRPVGGRLELKPAIGGAYLIDDSYNANPSSLKAGLDALQMRGGRRWLILGDMMELGPESDALHAEVGRYAQACGIERLFAVGTHTRHAVDAFGPGAQWFSSLDALVEQAKAEIEPQITLLIKGSRSNRLERAAQALSLNPSSSSTH